MIGFHNGRETGASLTLQPFFLLGNQVVRVFRLKDCLIILRVVLYEVCGGICSSFVKASAGKSLTDHLLKDGSWLEEGVDVHMSDFKPGSMFM